MEEMMRKCWTVRNGKASRGIPLSPSTPVIEVGEEGRGRTLVRVPVPPEAVLEEGLLIALPPRENEIVVVHLVDHSGYRGSWTPTVPMSREEAARIFAARAEERELRDRLLAAGKSDEYYAALAAAGHTTDGGHTPSSMTDCKRCRLPALQPFAPRIIAEGRRAQGDAGRAGGGPEYLLGFRAGDAVEIRRWGRLYGSPAIVRVEVDANGEVRTIDVEAEAMSASAASKL